MPASQKIFKVRRHYNKWVADQTLEDYALRFTAKRGRHMSIERVAQTALGATAFLALEGIAAAVTLSYGFTNTVIAMLVVAILFFVTGFPIAYYSAKHGLDIDLLTRGAGFGYLGSTITSLIYASFTFIFFAIEAAILASALHALFGMPMPLAYLICAVAVIPIVTHGISAISRFQVGTQFLWILLQCSALAVVVIFEYQQLEGWQSYTPDEYSHIQGFDILLFGAAASVFFALVAQIGEQVDYLRFMPPKTQENKRRWWFWMIFAGPGWIFVGVIKMLLGSFMAYVLIQQGQAPEVASDPVYMYQKIFLYMTQSPSMALVLAAVMVIISQMKINVTNAYAGSIAWSNFFSRLTHSHPGRVVWLVFNVTIALLLMELGIYQALEAILGIFAIVAVSWLCSLSADLLINKPLGLSPSYVEFKRAHLFDINPVGTGSMIFSCGLGMLCYLGLFGEVLKNLSHFVTLVSCFICVPLIAWITGGKFYLARNSEQELQAYITPMAGGQPKHALECGVCANTFETEDMSFCPAYQLPICSLCCSLDARCLDHCKPHARLSRQLVDFLLIFLPSRVARAVNSRLGRFVSVLIAISLLNAALLSIIYKQMNPATPEEIELLSAALWAIFFTLLIISGVVAWLFLLAHESRVVAQKESNRQTQKLMTEIAAHDETDRALQAAKETAENANEAKSRYMTGISHELRTPLQSILGYAHLLAEKDQTAEQHQRGLGIIQRSGQHLADLIEGLLDVSKIEAGKLELNRNRVKLPELIDQLAHMFSMQAKAKGIDFSYTVHDPLPQVILTDEKRLRQILINLLSNAIKYTREGQVSFDISYRSQVAEFAIRDTGVGIEADQLERIFEPFERIRNVTTPNVTGTGLGLTIVKLLTRIMGADLQVETKENEGSCFSVSILLPWASSVTRDDLAAAKIIGYEGFARTLYIVDDDPVLRGFISDLLNPLGFEVLESPDAEHCLNALNSVRPDAFLLDNSMPGMSGIDLAKHIRLAGIKVPILMLSADTEEQQRSVDEQLAFDDYMVKPVSNSGLLEKIAHHLSLTWVYEREEAPAQLPSTPVVDDGESDFAIPDHPLVRELHAYAQMGYLKGVNETLAKVESQKLLSDASLEEIRLLTQNFRFDRLTKLLEAAFNE